MFKIIKNVCLLTLALTIVFFAVVNIKGETNFYTKSNFNYDKSTDLKVGKVDVVANANVEIKPDSIGFYRDGTKFQSTNLKQVFNFYRSDGDDEVTCTDDDEYYGETGRLFNNGALRNVTIDAEFTDSVVYSKDGQSNLTDISVIIKVEVEDRYTAKVSIADELNIYSYFTESFNSKDIITFSGGFTLDIKTGQIIQDVKRYNIDYSLPRNIVLIRIEEENTINTIDCTYHYYEINQCEN